MHEVKTCPDCNHTSEEVEFYTKGQVSTRCKDCTKLRAKRRRDANIDEVNRKRREFNATQEGRRRTKDRHYRTKYGISLRTFENLLVLQQYKCACCKEPLKVGTLQVHVDHNHSTGKFRGILCHFCNTMLGMAKDDPERLRRGIAYLEGRGYYG